MEKTNLTDKEYLENELNEIEKLQEEVERIFHHKNPLVRFFLFNKAVKLHNKAHDKLVGLCSPYALPSKRDL